MRYENSFDNTKVTGYEIANTGIYLAKAVSISSKIDEFFEHEESFSIQQYPLFDCNDNCCYCGEIKFDLE